MSYLCFCVSIAPGLLIAWMAPESGRGGVSQFAWGMAFAAPGALVLALHHPAKAVTRPRQPLFERLDFLRRSKAWVVLRAGSSLSFVTGALILGFEVEHDTASLFYGTGLLAAALLLRVLSAGGIVAPRPGLRRAVTGPPEQEIPWPPDGEKRGFGRYLATRGMFLERIAVVFALLSLRLHGRPGALLVQLPLAVASAAWLWRLWRIAGMGSVRLTPLALPLRTGARAEFSFGLADGAAEIRRATFTLRHFREAAAEEATPLCTLAVAESGDPPPRTMQAGLDVVVAFDVPGDAPGTRMVSATPSYWEFEVVGETREGLYEERFLVPLYAAAERSSP